MTRTRAKFLECAPQPLPHCPAAHRPHRPHCPHRTAPHPALDPSTPAWLPAAPPTPPAPPHRLHRPHRSLLAGRSTDCTGRTAAPPAPAAPPGMPALPAPPCLHWPHRSMALAQNSNNARKSARMLPSQALSLHSCCGCLLLQRACAILSDFQTFGSLQVEGCGMPVLGWVDKGQV